MYQKVKGDTQTSAGKGLDPVYHISQSSVHSKGCNKSLTKRVSKQRSVSVRGTHTTNTQSTTPLLLQSPCPLYPYFETVKASSVRLLALSLSHLEGSQRVHVLSPITPVRHPNIVTF